MSDLRWILLIAWIIGTFYYVRFIARQCDDNYNHIAEGANEMHWNWTKVYLSDHHPDMDKDQLQDRFDAVWRQPIEYVGNRKGEIFNDPTG